MQHTCNIKVSSDNMFFQVSQETSSHRCPDQGNKTTPFDKQLEDSVQSTASIWLMYIDICNTVPAVIATLFICTLGDSMGRKFGIVATSIGSTLKVVLCLVAIHFKTSPYVILLGSLVEGMTGSHLCFLGSTFGYVADITTKKGRSIRMFILITVHTLSTAFTNLGVGYLIEFAGYTLVFWIFEIIHLLNTIYIIVCIPDIRRPKPETSKTATGSVQRRRRSSIQQLKYEAKQVGEKLYGAVQIFSTKSEIKRNRLKLGLLLAAFILQACVLMGKGGTDILFMLSYPRCFTSVTYGYQVFFSNIYHGAVGLICVWVLTRCIRDITIEIIGSLSFLAARLMFAFCVTQLQVYMSKYCEYLMGFAKRKRYQQLILKAMALDFNPKSNILFLASKCSCFLIITKNEIPDRRTCQVNQSVLFLYMHLLINVFSNQVCKYIRYFGAAYLFHLSYQH